MEGYHFENTAVLNGGSWLKTTLDTIFGDDYYITRNGRKVNDWHMHVGEQDGVFHLNFRLIGGKGGFGSMLRALGAQIEKTTNREACRDLSGRRMRDVNNEKKIADWLNKQAEKDAERKKRKQEKLERILNPPKHIMDSQSYVHSIQETAEEIDDALRKGLSNHGKNDKKAGLKRKAEATNDSPKRSKAWFGVDEEDSDEHEGDDEVIPYFDPKDTVSPIDNSNTSKSEALAESSESVSNGSSDDSSNKDKAGESKFANGSVELEQVLVSENGKADVQSNDTDSTPVTSSDTTNKTFVESSKNEPIELEKYDTIEELESLGLDRLKQGLIVLGLKCGGTLTQRAERLFLAKNTPLDQLDRSLFAKSNGKEAKKVKSK